MTLASRSRFERTVRSTLLVFSVIGIAASFAAHIEAVMGTDPRTTFKHLWTFQLLLLLVFLPVIVRIFQRRSFAHILNPPRWLRCLLYGALAYYAVNFYWFLFWAAEHLDAAMTWRVVSAGWILLFLTAIAFYDPKKPRML